MLTRLHLASSAALALALVACPGGGNDTASATDASSTTPVTATGTDATPTSTVPTSTDDTANTDATAGTAGDGTGGTSTGTSDTTQGLETTTTTSETTATTDPGETTTTTGPGETTSDTMSTASDGTTGEPVSDIEVIITADNAYGFAYGTKGDISQFFGGIENESAAQIFNCGEGPELYVVPAADAADATYLYIITWDDSSVTNGVLARFRRKNGGGGFGEDVFTGTKGWEACATGQKYELGSGGPDLATINAAIGKCNSGELDPNTTSGGWVNEVGTSLGAVAFGEDNTTPYDGGPQAGNEFPLVCPADMPAEARWMWFNWDPANVVPPESPFIFPGGQNPYHQFLLFRFAAELVPVPQ